MKFGIRQCANMVFRAKQETKIGEKMFHVGQPVLYIDTATTSSLEQAATTVYANGGRGNTRLIAWEGEKTMTFTVTDALLSPIGFHVLSGAGLFKRGNGETDINNGGYNEVHFHMTSMASMKIENGKGVIDLTEALAPFGVMETSSSSPADGRDISGTKVGRASICLSDAPIYIMKTDEDGSITGDIITGTINEVLPVVSAGVTYFSKLEINNPSETSPTNVMVDYYVDLPGQNVYEMDVTQDTFGGYYYVEADTLFRQKSTGKDLPANLTFPNVKIQSNFTMTFASTGDPSTFDFTMDVLPGYTYFDKTKEVLCVFQIVEDAYSDTASYGDPVMYHDAELQHNDVKDIIDYSQDSIGSMATRPKHKTKTQQTQGEG